MAANILAVCDALVEWIAAGLDSPTDAVVERVYLAPLDLSADTDRHVWVFPATYTNSAATRGEDEWVYSVGVVVAERCPEPGEASVSWLDERVEFAEAKVFDALDFSRVPLVFDTTRRLLTTQGDVTVYDDQKLPSKNLFWSEMRFEFREIQDA